MPLSEKVLIDTSVILENPEALHVLHKKGHLLFVDNTILTELDKHKDKSEGAIQFAARDFYRSFDDQEFILCTELARDSDTVVRSYYKKTPIHLINRKNQKREPTPDLQIIKTAEDYKFSLVTADRSMRVNAALREITSEFWGKDQIKAEVDAMKPQRQREVWRASEAGMNSLPHNTSTQYAPSDYIATTEERVGGYIMAGLFVLFVFFFLMY
jgi:predicted ribonuclease YlaK